MQGEGEGKRERADFLPGGCVHTHAPGACLEGSTKKKKKKKKNNFVFRVLWQQQLWERERGGAYARPWSMPWRLHQKKLNIKN